MSLPLTTANEKMLRGFLVNKCPRIKIKLVGTSEVEVEVIVDTGFNGQLTIPEEIAIKAGLIRTPAVSSSTIADGSSSPSDIYLGRVVYNNVHIDTVVEVQPEAKALLGMNLLEQLELSLFVDLGAERVELNHTTKGTLGAWLTRDF